MDKLKSAPVEPPLFVAMESSSSDSALNIPQKDAALSQSSSGFHRDSPPDLSEVFFVGSSSSMSSTPRTLPRGSAARTNMVQQIDLPEPEPFVKCAPLASATVSSPVLAVSPSSACPSSILPVASVGVNIVCGPVMVHYPYWALPPIPYLQPVTQAGIMCTQTTPRLGHSHYRHVPLLPLTHYGLVLATPFSGAAFQVASSPSSSR